MGFNDINPFYREKEDFVIRNGKCRICKWWVEETKDCTKHNSISEPWYCCKSFKDKEEEQK